MGEPAIAAIQLRIDGGDLALQIGGAVLVELH